MMERLIYTSRSPSLAVRNWQSFVRLPESPSAPASQSFTPHPHSREDCGEAVCVTGLSIKQTKTEFFRREKKAKIHHTHLQFVRETNINKYPVQLFLADEYSVQSQAVSDSLSSSCNDISCCWEIAPLSHPS